MSPTSKPHSTWLEEAHTPCDPATFLALMEVWQEGAKVPIKKPSQQRGGFYFTDEPLNRCALHTSRHMHKHGIPRPQAYLWRLMNFPLLLEAAPAYGLQDFIKGGEVHFALIRAAAVAELSSLEGEGTGFNMEDVARHAKEFQEGRAEHE